MRLLLLCIISFTMIESSAQTGVQPFANKNDNNLVFTKMEVLSTPKGGYEGWRKYVDSSLNKRVFYFPLSDSITKTVDSITVKFIVSKEGKLYDYRILSGNNLFINNLAIDLLKHSGKWHPGENGGRYLNSLRTFSMKFEMNFADKSIVYLPSQKDYWKRND